MLRKDVKLGFIIGGIMLAVVVVYVLVVPGGDKKSVGVVTDDTQPLTKTENAPNPAPDTPPVADNSNAPPAQPDKTEAERPTTNPSGSASVTTPTGGNTAGNGPDWNKLLAEGSASPTMMSETPTADTRHPATPTDSSSAPADKAPTDTPADHQIADSTAVHPDLIQPDLGINTESTPATQPAQTGARTHIVQPGEMLSSIAAASYGDSRKWKKIADANPTVNPNRLAPGTKLVIPAIKSSSETSSGTTAANIDPQTQYQVQPNDSLYRISMKLYGKADHVDKLYDANKDVIGSDPKRLKLNMILKLSDPPTSGLTKTASR